MKPGGPIRRKKRSASDYARVYGSAARVRWVKSLPCCCGCGRTPSDNAHTETEGMGRKAHFTTIAPLYRACHMKYDQHRAPFDVEERREAVKLHAAFTAAQWDYLGRTGPAPTPLAAIVPGVVRALLDGSEP